MNRSQQIEVIRAACVKANPEIVELKFGCEIQANLSVEDRSVYKVIGRNGNAWVCRAGNDEHCHTAFFGENSGFLIIGRPPRLADVLLAIRKKETPDLGDPWSPFLFVNSWGIFYRFSGSFKSGERVLCEYGSLGWILENDDLNLQSDDTISFLYELVK